MKSLYLLPLLLILIVPVAYGEITINQNSYNTGELMTITGNINFLERSVVTIQIIDPVGNLVDIAQIEIQDNNFIHNVITGGVSWKYNGDYTIRVSTDTEIIEIQFKMNDGLDPPKIDTQTINTITIQDLQQENIELGNKLEISEQQKIDLVNTNNGLRQENKDFLRQLEDNNDDSVLIENQKLLKQVEVLQEQTNTLQEKINNLNQIIQEQIKIIFDWVVSR